MDNFTKKDLLTIIKFMEITKKDLLDNIIIQDKKLDDCYDKINELLSKHYK